MRNDPVPIVHDSLGSTTVPPVDGQVIVGGENGQLWMVDGQVNAISRRIVRVVHVHLVDFKFQLKGGKSQYLHQ